MSTALEVLAAVLLTGVLLSAAAVTLAVLAVRRVVRRRRAVLRSVGERARSVLQPAAGWVLTSATLHVHALLPGADRRLAGLRWSLRREVAGTVGLVAAAEREGRPVAPLRALTRRLQQHARALDVDLAAAAAEPDPIRRRQLQAEHADRAEALRAACAQVRDGVRAAGTATTAPLAVLLEELDHEVTALRLRARAYQELV